MSRLYAWVTPAFDGPWVDHTWVTDYDNRITPHPSIQSVTANGARNWLCWGNFHAAGKSKVNPGGFIGSSKGSLLLAECLCKANVSSDVDVDARGTILSYGFDGVCHQLANQVLWATSASPLIVQQARGYRAGASIYGDYGINQQAWQQRMGSCTIRNRNPDPQRGGAMMLANAPDSFERHADSVLSEQKFTKLIKLRQQHQANLAELKASVLRGDKMPSAATLNALNNEFLRQAAELLGPHDFEEIFEIPAGEVVNLVDPELMEDAHI